MYGEQLRGTYKTDDYVKKLRDLRAGPYNSVDKKYDPKVTDSIHTVNAKRALWQQG
jgi:hypothetical protein